MSYDFKLVNGTIKLSSDGDMSLVTGQEKLSQDVIKIIATGSGTNLLYKWYGSAIQSNIIGSGLSPALLKSEISRSIVQCINTLQSLQRQQERSGQLLRPDEAISSLEGVEILNSEDPRDLYIVISIKTRAGRTVQEQLQLRI